MGDEQMDDEQMDEQEENFYDDDAEDMEFAFEGVPNEEDLDLLSYSAEAQPQSATGFIARERSRSRDGADESEEAVPATGAAGPDQSCKVEEPSEPSSADPPVNQRDSGRSPGPTSAADFFAHLGNQVPPGPHPDTNMDTFYV